MIALIYFFSIFLSYILMLLAMTMNGGLFVAIVCGLTTGYAIFGFRRSKSFTKILKPEGDKNNTLNE